MFVRSKWKGQAGDLQSKIKLFEDGYVEQAQGGLPEDGAGTPDG